MVGHNFRLGEIECAIGIEQLKKLDRLVSSRQRIAKLDAGLAGLKAAHASGQAWLHSRLLRLLNVHRYRSPRHQPPAFASGVVSRRCAGPECQVPEPAHATYVPEENSLRQQGLSLTNEARKREVSYARVSARSQSVCTSQSRLWYLFSRVQG